jgi:DNA-binding MurR/RpiR family transcriptional regulator
MTVSAANKAFVIKGLQSFVTICSEPAPLKAVAEKLVKSLNSGLKMLESQNQPKAVEKIAQWRTAASRIALAGPDESAQEMLAALRKDIQSYLEWWQKQA